MIIDLLLRTINVARQHRSSPQLLAEQLADSL
jgi:hypothetical protein